jgi:hypothetical protein
MTPLVLTWHDQKIFYETNHYLTYRFFLISLINISSVWQVSWILTQMKNEKMSPQALACVSKG